MIARRWRGWASDPAGADAYESHFSDSLRPALEATDGFVDATVERVEADGRVEIVVVTRWQSMDAIRSFAGDDIEAAVVEPEARAALADFDARVRHIELRDGDAFGHLELIDIPGQAATHEPWYNETLVTVNDAVIRLGIIEGDFHWHKHDDQDEFFFVVEGELLIDLQPDERTVTLGPHQGFSVPRGAVHRTRAPSRTVDPDGRGRRGRPDRRPGSERRGARLRRPPSDRVGPAAGTPAEVFAPAARRRAAYPAWCGA